MGVKFTEEQQKVIDLRNRNILVSAAAGSGKTAVLVERIITRLTKDESPINVDELLVVTFTEAAASEMKERIRAAIEKELEQNPDNTHLQRQATLIHHAQVTTIHSFCLSVIREYFHTIDLDPGFRIGEDGEMKLLKKDVVETVLEEAFASGNSEFLNWVESYATGRDDKKLEDMILQVYEYSRSYPEPEKWLQNCVKQYDISTETAFEESEIVTRIIEEVKRLLLDVQDNLRYASEICASENGPAAYGSAISADLAFVTELLRQKTFSGMFDCFSKLKWESLKANRKKEISEEKILLVKGIREETKKMISKIAEDFFYEHPNVLQKELLDTKLNTEVLIGLVLEFAKQFQKKKRDKNIIDFGDMEHYALEILTEKQGEKLVPSLVAKEYQEHFKEIMIDEYQDSNFLQEAILTSVSTVSRGSNNVFMVGDVKQSIYRFRLSRPELFMEKYDTYTETDSELQKVDLHMNFRSRKEVLEGTNFIFRQIMKKDFGGIEYDDKAALYVGASYDETEGNEAEIQVLEISDMEVDENKRELEAKLISKRIKELLLSYKVKDKVTGEYRQAKYSDIVILTRSLVGWTDVFLRVLTDEGIPAYSVSKEGYFETREIKLLLDYLKILDNPRQDIPLAAVLSSMFGNFTSEELALIKGKGEGKYYYDRLQWYLLNGEKQELQMKIQFFMDQFHMFRAKVPYTAIHSLLNQILKETGYDNIIASLPAGEQRLANVEMLIEKAIQFEATSYKGLFHFVRYIEQLHKYDVDYGEASIAEESSDVVRLMSIHKSKGLEFPIVFVAGMEKQFNLMDVRSSMVIHPELGVGLDYVDPERRVKNPTILKKMIQNEIHKESVAEELRVLYVALTRAKEKLIMTGTVTDFEKKELGFLSLAARKKKTLPYTKIASAKTYFDWVLPTIYCLKDAPIKLDIIDSSEFLLKESAEEITNMFTKDILMDWDTDLVYENTMKKQLETQFEYQYPYAQNPKTKQKLSVSELKKRVYLEEEELEEEIVIPLLPKFAQEATEISGASRGTAYHKVLEVLDFTKTYDEASLKIAIGDMVASGLLSIEAAECIVLEDILGFLSSSIGTRVRNAARKELYHAEQPFVLGETLEDGELLLVQGIIDVYFEEDGELVVLDYKTDRIWKDQEFIDKYKVQLDYYAKALEQVTGKSVKEKIIYSFYKKKEILLNK